LRDGNAIAGNCEFIEGESLPDLPISNVEWLLREAANERTLQLSQRTEFDDAQWKGTFERLRIGAGLRVHLNKVEARRDLALEAVADRDDPWIASQITLDGRTEIEFTDGARTALTVDCAAMYRLSGPRAVFRLEAGTRYQSAGYTLEPDRIEQLLDGNIPKVLAPLFDREMTGSRIVALQTGRRLRSLARSLFAPGLTGVLRSLMIEGTVLQLLAVQAALAADLEQLRAPRHQLTAREREAVHEARRLLLSEMRQPPTLQELATAVGLTEKRLNAGFRMEFGATVFEVLRNERLEHARIALQAPETSLKDVAFRVGYSHVANFITAFTARYGAPPRQYLERVD
jgi:AraC-like DNA-binding protein